MVLYWLKRLGVVLGLGVAILFLWRGLLIFASVIVLIAAATYVWHVWRQWRAVSRFRSAWKPQGKDVLLVYSNSPHWKAYVEDAWLPRWGHRAVVLNWSDRRMWQHDRRAEVALFRAFAGDREFNPLGIVVPLEGRRPHVVRFWRAFRDFKHGKDRLLRAAEAELDGYLTDPKAPGKPLQTRGATRRVDMI
jgi:hypothetical protein